MCIGRWVQIKSDETQKSCVKADYCGTKLRGARVPGARERCDEHIAMKSKPFIPRAFWSRSVRKRPWMIGFSRYYP